MLKTGSQQKDGLLDVVFSGGLNELMTNLNTRERAVESCSLLVLFPVILNTKHVYH